MNWRGKPIFIGVIVGLVLLLSLLLINISGGWCSTDPGLLMIGWRVEGRSQNDQSLLKLAQNSQKVSDGGAH